ncbi:MAG: dTDP-4-dehydrorhamnose 3,5-epimerase [Bacteroidota bacterium]
MTVRETTIPGVLVVEPVVHGDARGFFVETFQAERYAEAGIPGLGAPVAWAQLNQSRSRKNTLRGLHTQIQRPQGKLVRVARGAIYDVVLDLRPGSPTFGQWEAHELDDEAHRQLWVPPGLAHGFCVTSEVADVAYACTTLYDGSDEGGVIWNDPDLSISWPVDAPLVSEKDRRLPRLRDLAPERLPQVS